MSKKKDEEKDIPGPKKAVGLFRTFRGRGFLPVFTDCLVRLQEPFCHETTGTREVPDTLPASFAAAAWRFRKRAVRQRKEKQGVSGTTFPAQKPPNAAESQSVRPAMARAG